MKHTCFQKIAFCLIFLTGLLAVQSINAQLTLKEETVTIPTYLPTPPDRMPRFYEGKGHQGVQRHIYPYPYDDGLTANLQDVSYHSIHVENQYIDLSIMPALGGRIYYANDKTNGYNYLYHNHVVKPSLIGMVGNWISGSLAWGYPHHHGPHTVEPMDYKIEEHTDGSKPVWINTTDRLMRVNLVVGYTVYPNSSIVEMTIRPRNRSAVSNSFLFWANPAVHCDSAYQVIFPPSVQYVTFHSKNWMTTWPVADGVFNNYDFSGEDVSWWKNTHIPSSFFSWDPKEDYFGGYDHNLKAGTVWVGNHHVSPGMKYWADGNNAHGLKTNEGLTDNDGRYIELMAGFYTDNQPDYSWMQPYETKQGSMLWFPMRELDGLKYANRNGAMNYFMNGQSLDIRLNTTSPYSNAKLVVGANGKEVFSKIFNISPSEPQKALAKLPENITEDDLDIALLDASGKLILDYRPFEHHPPKYDKPEPFKGLAKPEELKTVEELYLAGLRLNQFHNTMSPTPYYEAALKIDPEDYRTNTQLGILAIKDHNWELAEKYLRTAVKRITSNYTRPKDGEGLYYLALTLRALDKAEEAYDLFYQATWTYAWHTAAYFQLAEMDCERGNFEVALDHVNRSISTNTDNIRSLNLKIAVLRKLNRLDEALQLADETIETTTINHFALNEKYRLEKRDADLQELTRLMRDAVQSYLELATEYAQAGFYSDALDILSRLEKKGETYPMLYYSLGYYNERLGDSDKALSYYQKAAQMPSDYCFPFRSEEIYILQNAMEMNPDDAKAPFYLGNLLYEHQPEKAIALWEKSAETDDSFYIVQRNLGLACKDVQHDFSKALNRMNKALANNKENARLLFEIDVLNELNRFSPKDKYDFLKKNIKTAKKRSETILRLATRAVEYGKYDEALNIMENNRINESEGANEMQNNYLNIYSLKALQALNNGKVDAALVQVNKLLEYPVGLRGRSRYAQIYYIAATAYGKKGEAGKANEFLEKTVAVNIEPSDKEFDYYRGLALSDLGKKTEAKRIFDNLLNSAAKDDNASFSQFATTDSEDTQLATNHYLAGLAYLGLNDKIKASQEFKKAQEYMPSHIWANYYLISNF
ncbi:MAG: DUF5107 domain-containing protein [Candidatus Symbiothrix sp.]|jgi:tetratricopeptide (TPR) repeat protein|nr:DUF5107 domain-containing protein [Candidatus Symbiothrix sp.]